MAIRMQDRGILEKIRRRNSAAELEIDRAELACGVTCAAHPSLTHGIKTALSNQEDTVEAILESRNGAASISFMGMKLTTHNAKDLMRLVQFGIIVYLFLAALDIVPLPEKILHKAVTSPSKPPIEVTSN